MALNNLLKTFVYKNDDGEAITLTYDGGYLISKPVGIDTVSVTISEAQGIGQTGTTIRSANVDSRPVTISGIIVGDSQTEKKERLMEVVRPDLGGKLFCDDYYLEIHPTDTPTIEAKTRHAKFQFALLAPYPYWMKAENAYAALSGVEKRFKFPWNISRPYRFGEVVTRQFITIHNSGQLEVPFTVTFTALDAVTNPKIIDAKTNNYLLVKKSMVAGERLVVEITHDRVYVTSSADGECRGALDIKSKFYRLRVGDNVIKPEADSGKNNLSVSIDYAIEKTGVVL
nr:MAG TPA: tail protein [Caudoviricetes sp.]